MMVIEGLKKVSLLIVFSLLIPINLIAQSIDTNFTADELKWLEEHPVIKVSNEMDWPPFDFAIGDKAQGYSIDLLNLLAERIGFKIKYVNNYTWDELIDLFKNGELDLLHSAAKTLEREEFALFSNIVTQYKSFFVTRDGFPEITEIRHLENKTVAVIKGYAVEEYLRQEIPEAIIYHVNNIEEALLAVSLEKADVTITNDYIMRFITMQKRITNLKISGWCREFDQGKQNDLHYMVHLDAPELVSILNKALLTLLPSELNGLDAKWFGENIAEDKDNSKLDTLNLTEEEKSWIENNPLIQVAATPDWAPFEFQEKGEYLGLHADMLRLAASKTGLSIEPVFDRWSTLQDRLKEGTLDLCPGLNATDSRKEYLLFTDPVSETSQVIITRTSAPVSNISDLAGGTVAVEKGYANEDFLKEYYPLINLLSVDDTVKALEAVITGEADAYVGTQAVCMYLIKKNRLTDLKVSTFMSEALPSQYRIGVINSKPLLRDILQKGLEAISVEELAQLQQKWFGISGSIEPVTKPIELTQEEKEFIIANPLIRVHNEMDWPPFNFNEDGKPLGFSIDYMNLLAEKTGIELQYISGPKWGEFLEMMESGDLDLMLNIVKTEER